MPVTPVIAADRSQPAPNAKIVHADVSEAAFGFQSWLRFDVEGQHPHAETARCG